MMEILNTLLEVLKWFGVFVLVLLSIVLVALIFLFVVSLLLVAIYLAVSCACELWDIYLKDVFEHLRAKRKARKENK